MHLKTIPLQKEYGFITDSDTNKLWREIKTEQTDRLIVAIDGAPGTGKSVLAEKLRKIISSAGIQANTVETDLDCLPWSERPHNSTLMDWHSDTVSKEVVNYPGAHFTYTGYDTVTHERTKTSQIVTPRNGVLLLEGLHSVEFAQEQTNQPIVAIIFQISNELREIRRAERNIRQGRWKPSEVESRTASQRSSAVDFYRDLEKDSSRTSAINHNTIRTFS